MSHQEFIKPPLAKVLRALLVRKSQEEVFSFECLSGSPLTTIIRSLCKFPLIFAADLASVKFSGLQYVISLQFGTMKSLDDNLSIYW